MKRYEDRNRAKDPQREDESLVAASAIIGEQAELHRYSPVRLAGSL